MKKWVYYLAFCLIVFNVGSIIQDLIFADEINYWKIDANIGHIFFGIVAMCYYKLSKCADENQGDLFITILAIDNVCDEECTQKIKEEAVRLNALLHVNPPKFFEELDKKAREKANKGGKNE